MMEERAVGCRSAARGHRRHLRVAVTSAVVLSALALAACGSNNDNNSSSSAGGSATTAGAKGPAGHLTVATSSLSGDLLNYVADDQGYFKAENVDVKIMPNVGANTVPLVSSGQTDLVAYPSITSTVLSSQGKPTTALYVTVTGGSGGVLATNPKKADSIQKLQGIKGCKIGTFPEGTLAYGTTVTYIQNLKLDCTVTPFQDASAMIGGLSSGRVDALVGGYAFFSQAVKAGKAKILIDTTNPQQRAQYVPSGLPENAFWGLTKTVKAKRAVIIPWLRAIDKARTYVADPANTSQIAKMLIDKGYAEGMEQSAVEHDIVDAFRSYLPTGPQPGYITKEAWDKQLSEAEKWKVPNFNSKAPTSQYDQAVDMSYYTAALGNKGS